MEKSGDGLIQQSGRLGYEVSVGCHPSPPSSHLVTLPTLIIEVVHADSAISGRPALPPLFSKEMRVLLRLSPPPDSLPRSSCAQGVAGRRRGQKRAKLLLLVAKCVVDEQVQDLGFFVIEPRHLSSRGLVDSVRAAISCRAGLRFAFRSLSSLDLHASSRSASRRRRRSSPWQSRPASTR
jgi:hypothetical protein